MLCGHFDTAPLLYVQEVQRCSQAWIDFRRLDNKFVEQRPRVVR